MHLSRYQIPGATATTDTRIRVGIIGAHPGHGWDATAHLPALEQLPQFRVTTVSHHSLETAQPVAAKFGISNAVATTPELVSDVPLLVITVKVTRHRKLVGGLHSRVKPGWRIPFCQLRAVAW